MKLKLEEDHVRIMEECRKAREEKAIENARLREEAKLNAIADKQEHDRIWSQVKDFKIPLAPSNLTLEQIRKRSARDREELRKLRAKS